MKAWEKEKEILHSGIPCYQADDNESIWEENAGGPEEMMDIATKVYWHSQVPGSRAHESIALAAIQATENKGYTVDPKAMELIEQGYKAYDNNDYVEMHKLLYDVFRLCDNAKKDESSPYWNQKFYDTFEEYEKVVKFPTPVEVDMSEKLDDKMIAGWLGQIIGGAYGTCIEGYTGTNIRNKYGAVDKYIRKPNTYNDDITYELALLMAYKEFGKETTALEIAREWIARIPTGWSAEDFALRNLKAGIMPPESGRFHNAFNEWIGAQMRGAIAGQLYPGNVKEAARCAWMDGSISHDRNGILGEVFNAIMTSMSFYESDIRKIVKDAIELMPEDSEYGQVVRFAYDQCQKHDDFFEAWMPCEKQYEKYNWIHAYPNAAAEVIALWYGNGDFNKTISYCGSCGQDVDCNAAQIMTIVSTIHGTKAIPEYWKAPIGDDLFTYVRGLKEMKISELGKLTAQVARKLK